MLNFHCNPARLSGLSFRVLALALAASVAHAQSQGYPNKPITIILPYAPGGATSSVGYLIREKLMEGWGQPVVMQHRPGGSATIGAAIAAKAPADGYTYLIVTATHVISPLLMKVPYDPIRDFAAVSPVSVIETVVVAHPSLPAKNLKELVALAKARPGQLNYATASFGSNSHLAAELLGMRMGIRLQNVPYKGGGPATTDVLGGQVELMFANPVNVTHHIQAGKLVGIVISGRKRAPALPQVPTFEESGVTNFDIGSWMGVLAPAGTPGEIVRNMAGELARIMALPDIKAKVVAMGSDTLVESPDAFEARMKGDLAKYARVVKERRILQN
jgi:tripartite-type tricarboxylate transporter receptor subunit TctC